MTEGWVEDCVLTLRMLDGQVIPVDDETLVRELVSTYERAREPEWSDVSVWELVRERDRLRADLQDLEGDWLEARETIHRLRAERNTARNIAVALEQEVSRCNP